MSVRQSTNYEPQPVRNVNYLHTKNGHFLNDSGNPGMKRYRGEATLHEITTNEWSTRHENSYKNHLIKPFIYINISNDSMK